MRLFRCLLSIGLLVATLPATAATYKYVTTVTISMPTGSAGATAWDGMPTGIKTSPCSTALTSDQVTVTLKYDAGKLATEKKDTYLLIVRMDSAGTTSDPRFFPIKKVLLNSSTPLVARANVQELNSNKLNDIYVSAANNLGGAITETVLGGNIPVEGLSAGIWLIVSIIADSASVNFDDPSTWLAWDAAPLMLRKPWQGSVANTCL